MNSSLYKIVIVGLAVASGLLLISTAIVTAADDPSIKSTLRENIKASMMSFIENNMVDGNYIWYDAIDGRLLKLQMDKLHDGIVKKGVFYVSCADFYDTDGKKIDMDFLVVKDGDQFKTIQGVVHSVDGKMRQYHLES